MALVRGFAYSQFRGAFLGTVGPVVKSGTPASTLTGVNSTFSITLLATDGFLPGDLVFIVPQGSALVAGVFLEGYVTTATNLAVTVANGNAGTYNPGASTFQIFALRLKTA